MRTAPVTKTADRPGRDPRLDVFRGWAMVVILIAHITDNTWTLWSPSRFGFSDATEIFVFCSGIASALAFGATFDRAGFLIGFLRVAKRVWQVYWVHLGIFFTALTLMLALNRTEWFEQDYVRALNLYPFLLETGSNLIGLMTLTYVPNYFDVLPMYVVLLALIPVAVALARISPALMMAGSATLWLYANVGHLNMPAEWWFSNGSVRPWFFDPFAWQLVFFTGFAFASGWLPVPPVRRALVWLALAYVVLTLPLAWHKTLGWFESLRTVRADWWYLFDKTQFGFARYVHFLALAYLGWVWAGPRGARFAGFGALGRRIVAVLTVMGQQSLPLFAASMVMARLLGVVLDVTGRGPLASLTVNLGGLALLVGIAYFVSFLKSEPWRGPRKPAEVKPEEPALIAGEVRS